MARMTTAKRAAKKIAKSADTTRTATQTISGSVPEPIVRRVREVARLEDRTTSQVVASALDLYTRLPTELHVLLRRIAVERGEEGLQQTLLALGREVVAREFDAARQAVVQSMKHDRLDALNTEEEVMDFAVQIIKESYARDRAEHARHER